MNITAVRGPTTIFTFGALSVKADYLWLSGCDRHLLGLQIIAMESGMPMPEIYTDPAYQKRFVLL